MALCTPSPYLQCFRQLSGPAAFSWSIPGEQGHSVELWGSRGAGGAVTGSSLSTELSPSVACGLILVCAHSSYSVGSCQSSNAHAADHPVRVSLFDCLGSWN